MGISSSNHSRRSACPNMSNTRNDSFQHLLMLVLCFGSFLAGSLLTTIVRIERELGCPQSHVTNMLSVSDEQSGIQHGQQNDALQGEKQNVEGMNPGSVEYILEQRKQLMKEREGGMTMKECLELQEQKNSNMPTERFPSSVNKYAAGMARVSRDNFTSTFDTGVPLENTTRGGGDDVLILYKRPNALPVAKKQHVVFHRKEVPLLTAEEATLNCDSMHVILTDPGSRRQCMAIVPQYQSFHIQNWMRVDKEKNGPLERDQPLRMISRGHQPNGRDNFLPPGYHRHTKRHWSMLQRYFSSLPQVLNDLGAKAKKVARNNTVVVMVANFGHSELLMNFECSAKSRGVSTDQVLVFATDPDTKALAESLGLTAYYDEMNFKDAPSEAADHYGDMLFAKMMLAKVYCVQLVSLLGYDLLFQDVDVVWFRDPVAFFQNNSTISDFDIYFQDDGQHSIRYAPYSANSGFYYVRHNQRTQYFLTSLLMAGDLVLSTKSHQQALIALLSEHSSLYGLRVKVLSRDQDEFPGGYHFHQKTGKWMKAFFRGEKDPYIFHMSWTTNKANKLLFLQQMGEWYVHEKCIGKAVSEGSTSLGLKSFSECCSTEPLISCHYRDKPSKFPCNESPNIDEGRDPFW